MIKLKCFVCNDDCFRVEGTDYIELKDIIQIHFRKVHKTRLTDQEIKKMIKEC